jgi:hypothetical protein
VSQNVSSSLGRNQQSKYLADPDIDKLLLELELKGRQLEYDGITLANLKSGGDRGSSPNPHTKGAAGQNQKIEEKTAQKDGAPQGQGQGQRQELRDRNHHGDKDNKKKNYRYCETCSRTHWGNCWPICRDCGLRHHPKNKCPDKQKPNNPSELQGETQEWGNSAAPESSGAASDNVFRYGLSRMLTAGATGPLTKDSWIFDTGASYHICNNWRMMEEVVQGETQITTATTG